MKKWINPANALTATRFVSVAALAYLYPAVSPGWIVAILFGGYYLTDQLDGPVARWTGTAGEFGRRFDAFTDRFCDLALAAVVMLHVEAHAPSAAVFAVLRLSVDSLLPAAASRVERVAMEAFFVCRVVFFATALLGGAATVPGLALIIMSAVGFVVGLINLWRT